MLPDIPHIMCLTENHLNEQEIEPLFIEKLSLGGKYYRNNLKQGGSCIFVHKSLTYPIIKRDKFCKEQNFEISTAKTALLSVSIIIICIYRSTNGNMALFLKNFDIV